jgi:hypothetical protein
MPQPPVDLLAECLDAIERGELTVEEGLAQYPEHRRELAELLGAALLLQSLPAVEPRPAFRSGARARLLERVAATHPRGWRERLKRASQVFTRPPFVPSRFAWVPAAILVLALLAGGTAYAADGAVPGAPLYGLDRALEEIQLAMQSQPEQAARLNLAFASERLAEAQALAEAGDTAGLVWALDEYDTLLTGLSSAVRSGSNGSSKALEELVRGTLAGHETGWGEVFTTLEQGAQEAATGPDPEPDPTGGSCTADKAHPAARVLADSYSDITFEQALNWFCESGYKFSDIKLALKTRMDAPEYSVEQLLALKQELGGWGQVWQAIGAIGKPDETGEAPESASPPGQENEPPGQIGKDKDKGNKKDKEQKQDKGGSPGSGGGQEQAPGNSGGSGKKDKDQDTGNGAAGRGTMTG